MVTIRLIAAFAACAATALPAAAQNWPIRPVTMVVPYTAGGAADVSGRIFAMRLSELLGQQVIVENISGAGGMTGSARVAKAPPDGYQFVRGDMGTHAQNQSLYKKALYNAATDFAPVALLTETPQILVARKDFPANTLAEFIIYAKANQAKMQYGSPGAGSPPHLACALLNPTIGINATHIPYRGSGQVMQDLIVGRFDYSCAPSTVAIPLIESELVKAIAILSKNRSATLPTLATAQEQGLTDFDVSAWGAFFLPKGTRAEIVRKLHDATVATMETPSVQARLKENGVTVVASERRSTEYLQKFVESEIEKGATAIKAGGVIAD